MSAQVVEPVGWKRNWSEKRSPGGGALKGGVDVITDDDALNDS